MEEPQKLEKLGNHKYRLTVAWDGTENNREYFQRNNFQFIEKSNIYFAEFEMESELFNYGVSMSECYQTMFQNGQFSDDFIRFSFLQPVNTRMMKEAERSVPLSSFLETLINMTGVDNFMYFIAKNYDSALAKEAERQYGDMDKDSFLGWLIEKITPRFSGNFTKESMASYYIADIWIKKASNINWPYSFFCAWEFVADHKEEYSAWRETVRDQDGIDIDVISSLLNNVSSKYTQYFQFYFFTEGISARRLFQMRNSSSVDYNTKKLIQDVLVDYCKTDSEFAKTLQKKYSEYKSISGGIDIDFAQQVFENEMFVFPEDDIKYHLSHDLYDEDKDGFIGKINPIYNDPEKLTRVFKELVKLNRVRPNELDTFVYRFTGQRKPKMIIDKIHWHGPEKDLLYLFKRFYGRYGEIKHFFDIEMKTAPKNYSAYAERATQALKDLFAGLFGIKNA